MKKYYLIVISFILICNSTLLSNQQEEAIEISPFIGRKLDRVERDYFNLFPKIEGFKDASFYLNPDSSLKVSIVYERDGHLKDTVLTNYKSLSKVQNHIDHYLTYFINDIDPRLKGNFTDVKLVDNSKISGELLSVRQTAVIIYGMSQKSFDNKENVLFNANNINYKKIDNIYFKKKSKLLSIIYPIIGGIVGAIVGYNLSKNQEIENPGLFQKEATNFLGILGGMAVGMIASIPLVILFPIETESETVFETPFNEKDIVGLRDYARYKDDQEPYYLTKFK